MRLFHLKRSVDDSGVSGTGVVAEGVIFKNGNCILHWLTQYSSLGFYETIEQLEKIHGHGGHTQVVYNDNDLSNLHAPNPVSVKASSSGLSTTNPVHATKIQSVSESVDSGTKCSLPGPFDSDALNLALFLSIL